MSKYTKIATTLLAVMLASATQVQAQSSSGCDPYWYYQFSPPVAPQPSAWSMLWNGFINDFFHPSAGDAAAKAYEASQRAYPAKAPTPIPTTGSDVLRPRATVVQQNQR